MSTFHGKKKNTSHTRSFKKIDYKNIPTASLLANSSPHHPWFLYIIYAVIVAVLGYNLLFSINAATSSGNSGSMCNMSSCGEGCGCGGTEADINDDSGDATEEAAPATVTTTPAPAPCAGTTVTPSSSISGQLFSFTFSGQICEDTTASIYLSRDASSGGPEYIYQNVPVRKYQTLSGSGSRSIASSFTQVCVVIGSSGTKCG